METASKVYSDANFAFQIINNAMDPEARDIWLDGFVPVVCVLEFSYTIATEEGPKCALG